MLVHPPCFVTFRQSQLFTVKLHPLHTQNQPLCVWVSGVDPDINFRDVPQLQFNFHIKQCRQLINGCVVSSLPWFYTYHTSLLIKVTFIFWTVFPFVVHVSELNSAVFDLISVYKINVSIQSCSEEPDVSDSTAEPTGISVLF